MIFSNLVFFRIQSVDHAVVWSCASVYGLGGERERQRERERERARVRARGGQEEGCDGARGIVWEAGQGPKGEAEARPQARSERRE